VRRVKLRPGVCFGARWGLTAPVAAQIPHSAAPTDRATQPSGRGLRTLRQVDGRGSLATISSSPRTAPLRPLLDREPVAAQDGLGHRAIAVLTLAFALLKRPIPGVRLGPAGEAAFRPPASRGEGAEGAAFVRPMRSSSS
jgi:hypothetical protein